MISRVTRGYVHDGCTALYLDCGHCNVIHNETDTTPIGAEVECTVCDGKAGDLRRMRDRAEAAEAERDAARAALRTLSDAVLAVRIVDRDGCAYSLRDADTLEKLWKVLHGLVRKAEQARAALGG